MWNKITSLSPYVYCHSATRPAGHAHQTLVAGGWGWGVNSVVVDKWIKRLAQLGWAAQVDDGRSARIERISSHPRLLMPHSHVSPTCRTAAGSGPPPLNSLMFRPVVGQPSEVLPFQLLEQRCGGMACQVMLRRPRRCRCSRTGWRHTCTCSAAATKLTLNYFFPSHYLPSRTVVIAIVFTV